MRIFAAALAALAVAHVTASALAAPVDDIADVLIQDAEKPAITQDSLPADFARLTRFVRHDGGGMVLFTDGGSTDGYVRHAMAHFDTRAAQGKGIQGVPLFLVAFELVDQPDFTFDGLSAALEQRLGPPTTRSNQSGATFRTWQLPQLEGRSLTVARAQASDNGDPITVAQIMQNR
jgi:prepilin-type processing-associated H-X9-DG protein